MGERTSRPVNSTSHYRTKGQQPQQRLSAHVAVLGLGLGWMVVVGCPVSALVVEQGSVFLAALGLDDVQVAPRGIVVPWSRQTTRRHGEVWKTCRHKTFWGIYCRHGFTGWKRTGATGECWKRKWLEAEDALRESHTKLRNVSVVQSCNNESEYMCEYMSRWIGAG